VGPLSGARVGIAEFAGRRRSKSARIKPVLDVVERLLEPRNRDCRQLARLYLDLQRCRVESKLDPLAWKFTPEVKLALSTTNTGKPEVSFSITVHLPVPEYGVHGTAPVIAKLLALANGQVIDDAGG